MNAIAETRLPQTMHCPTCHAEQAWSDECRRCKCDLSLVRSMAEYAEHIRRQCLLCLRTGQYVNALALAQELTALDPSEDSRRLLAACLLRADYLAAAVTIAARYEPH